MQCIPSIRRVVEILRRHTTLALTVEAHCGLEAHPEFAKTFAKRRALSVRRTMEEIAEEQGAPGALAGRLVTRSWGSSRPLIWAPGSEDRGRINARVEVYLSHGETFEAPRRRALSEYARSPTAPPLPEQTDEEAHEAERVALEEAIFDPDVHDPADEMIEQQMGGRQQQVIVELPGGERVMLPVAVLEQLHALPNQQDALAYLRQMILAHQQNQIPWETQHTPHHSLNSGETKR